MSEDKDNNPDKQELSSYDIKDKQEREISKVQQRVRQNKIRKILSPLGKLHNVIVHIRASPQRTAEVFEEAQIKILLNNHTR
jgi:hypothetical protein